MPRKQPLKQTETQDRLSADAQEQNLLCLNAARETGSGLLEFVDDTQEIDARKAAEQTQRRRNTVLDVTPDYIMFCTIDGSLTDSSRAFRTLCGLSVPNLSRSNLFDFYTEAAAKLMREIVLPAAIQTGMWSGEAALKAENGAEEVTVHQTVIVHYEPDGRPESLTVICRNITESRRAAQEMERYIEERTANLQEAIEFMQQEIAERARAEAEVLTLNRQLEERLHRIDALRQIDAAIASSFDLRLTLGVFLEQTLAQLQVDAADILICNPYEHRLEFGVGRGFRTTALRYTRLQFGAGYAGRAAMERHLVHIVDLKQEPGAFRNTPLLSGEQFVSYVALPLISKGQVRGVLEIFYRRKFQPDLEWLDFMETLAGQAAIAIDNAQMFEGLQRSNLELTLAYDATIEGWSRALDLRDHETEGHTQRVTALTLELARAMGIGEADLVGIRRGALLHDIGKVGVPDSILHKPGELTADERDLMQQHTQYAYQMLAPIAFLRSAIDIPYCHHEKWDGTGYPRGLKGGEIPLAARLFSVVDVWDALRSNRPYKKAWTHEQSCEHIQRMAGTHFDPAVVETFLRVVNEFRGYDEARQALAA